MGQAVAEGLGQRLVAERGGHWLVQDGEPRVDPGLDRVAAQDLAAEGVERADPGRFETSDDPSPVSGVNARLDLEPALATNPVAQLAGGLVGKGQGDDLAERDRGRAVESPDESLGQHGRLAAARPGAQGDAGPGDGQGLGLLGGES